MMLAVIFDLGGTLLEFNPQRLSWLEWERQGIESAYAYLSSQGCRVDKEAFVARFIASLPERWQEATEGGRNLRLDDMLREACAAGGAAPVREEIARAVAHYIAPLDAHVTAYDDALGTLRALRERGLKIGLLSNTMWPGAYHRQEMARFGLLSYFDCVAFSADVALWKPQPAIYHLALDGLGVSAADAFFVGDIPQHDLVGAQAVGMRTVYKANPAFALDGIHADATIAHLAELPSLVDRW
jgi:putative hydrolase of the HAD superfamily